MVYLINGEKSLIDKEVNDLIKKYNCFPVIYSDEMPQRKNLQLD